MEPTTIEVWITKYALTIGIVHDKKARVCTGCEGMVASDWRGYTGYYVGNNWFDSEQKAKIYAEVMRQRKLQSLAKAHWKLLKKDINVVNA